ncbi:MAG: HmuY family protein [Gemmatimonas sp.]
MYGISSTRSRGARVAALAATMIGALTLSACESEGDPTGPNDDGGDAPVNTIVTASNLNAVSNDTFVAFSLAKNAIVPKSGDWDILLRRYEIRVNSTATAGASTKNVTAYAMSNNATASDAQLLAFTVQNTLPAFDAIRAADIPAASAFQTDRLVENEYGYLTIAGVPVVNPASVWKVRTANGGFALTHATAITLPGQTLTSVTFETRVQGGQTLGAAQTLVVPLANAPVAISLVTNSVVTANGCNWDFLLNPTTFAITTNAACNTGTYPAGSSPTFANIVTASDAPQYLSFLSQLYGPIANSTTDVAAPYRYNLLGNNRLHPTFNTYLIKVGTRVYKLQSINYYNESGTSGYVTLRSARLQ